VFIRGHKRSEVQNEHRDIFERRLLVFLEGAPATVVYDVGDAEFTVLERRLLGLSTEPSTNLRAPERTESDLAAEEQAADAA
jgi:hypothetical protein